MSIQLVMPSKHLILCCPLLLLPLIFPSTGSFLSPFFSSGGQSSGASTSVSVQLLFMTPWTAAYKASFSITNSRSSLKLMSIESVMPSNHLILCHLLLLLSSVFPCSRGSSNVLALCIRWQNYWSFTFIISPSNEYSGLISFRIDWFDLFAVSLLSNTM